MGKKSASRANERERFYLDGEESESVNNSTRPTKSKATIEEIHEGDEDYNNKPDRTNETKKNNQPKKPAPGVKLTPTQRKSMQKANKNPHNGGKSSVTVTDADDDEDELINEEDEGVEGLSSSDGDGGDDGSDSDVGSDGEADWERDDAPKIIAKKSPNHPSKPWTLSSILLWTSVFVLLCGLVWLRLQDASIWEGIDPDDIDMTTRPPSEQEDYYQILQVDRNADMKQIKASYRKLVLQTHPDKNPDSDSSKFQAVQKAYDVLSNPEKRAMYDSIETTYDVLQSETVELTTANFESEVLQTDAVWVIQVYTDWHKSAIRFSQAWEEAAQRYGKLVSFGRVHAHRQRELTKRLHTVKFGVIPTVVIYSNGQFSDAKTFLDSSHQALSKLSHFIADHFPNTVSSVGNSLKEMKSFMKSADSDQTTARVLFFPDFAKQAATQRKQHQQQRPQHGSQQQRFQQQMLANKNRINEPSLTYKAIARKFQYAVQFGQVEQIAEPAKWKSWIKEICTTYKLSAPSSLPALLYQESDDSSPKWLTGDLTKDKLLKHMDGVHKRMVPWMNSHSYARHCVEAASKSSTICVIGLACQPLKIGELEFNSFASGGRALQKQAAFRNVPLQFAKVDIARQSDMAPLCASLPADAQKSSELSIVVIMNHGTELYHFGQREHQHQQFDAWLNHVVKQDGKIKSLAAPFIPVVHIPDDVLPLTLPSVGQVFIPLRWIYGIGIIGALIILSPIISQYFAKFVYFIFALSIIVPGLELMKDVYEKYYLS